MRNLVPAMFATLLALLTMNHVSQAQRPEGVKSTVSIYSLSFTSIDGKTVPLERFKGRKILFVNVASECGYTPQYADLEKLWETYRDKLVVIGFPANDFGAQEPGTNEEIQQFCTEKYHVTFLLAQKSDVIGDRKNPVYTWLTDKSKNGWNDQQPKWNFWKYLVDETGELVRVFPSKVKPMSDDILTNL